MRAYCYFFFIIPNSSSWSSFFIWESCLFGNVMLEFWFVLSLSKIFLVDWLGLLIIFVVQFTLKLHIQPLEWITLACLLSDTRFIWWRLNQSKPLRFCNKQRISFLTFGRILAFWDCVIFMVSIFVLPFGGFFLGFHIDFSDSRISLLVPKYCLEKTDFYLILLPSGCVLLNWILLSTTIVIGRWWTLE